MLTLIEPCILSSIVDRPHLGCAMLISACQERGIKTTLIKGQTRYLKDMFVNDSEELWNLIQDLKEDDLKKIKINDYKKSLQKKGMKEFQKELKDLYHYVIIEKNPRHYFNAKATEKFYNLHNIFLSIYLYYLKELNHSNLRIIEHYIREITKSNPHYIGFSLQNKSEPFSRIIRKRLRKLTDVPIIAGGSITPFIDLKKIDMVFEKECFDYLIVGAADHALPSLIEEIENKKAPRGIPNVFYKKEGKIHSNELKVIDDLDNLPFPDYSQFDLDSYLTPKRILPLQTARGCSWERCAFCSHGSIYLGKYMTFSIEKVIKTIKYLKNTYSCSHFVFHDEELPPSRAKKISEAIFKNNLKNISIYTYARLTEGYNNSKFLNRLQEAGFSTFAWGLESGNQRVLDLMSKGTKISTMAQTLEKSSRNGISNICFVLFGFPGETEEEAKQTIKFLKKHADYIDEMMLSVFRFEGNSPIQQNPQKWGVEIRKDGSYSTKNGMDNKQAKLIFYKFSAELMMENLKTSSEKLRYVLPGNNRRMLHFLSSSYGRIPNRILLGYLSKKKINNAFPLILGEIEKNNNINVFRPINISKTCLVNKNFPKKEKILDNLEERIFALSDGTLSFEDIILTIDNELKREYRREYVYKKCINFFRDIFFKNYGLGFERSWR